MKQGNKAVNKKGVTLNERPAGFQGLPRLSLLLSLRNIVRGRFRIKYGMTPNLMSGLHPTYNGNGFTLIELLVVVLIIGILAAVALPQYQKVVERSKATQALTLVKAVAQAQQAYLLANGEYATKFDELAIDIPFTGNTKFKADYMPDTKSDANWSLQIEDARPAGFGVGLYMMRINGKYKGAGFPLLLVDNNVAYQDLPILCIERKSGATILFDSSLAAGAYCVQIMKGSLYKDTQYNRIYNLP